MSVTNDLVAAPIDLSVQAMSPRVDESEARALADKIDVRSPMAVARFGEDVGKRAADYADTLLEQARGEDLDELGGKLGEIMVAAQSFDLDSFDNNWSRLPVVGPIVRHFSLSKERVMTRFRSVEAQIDKLVLNVAGAQKRLGDRAATFDAMYDSVVSEHTTLATYVRAGELRLQGLDAEIAAMQVTPGDLAAAETLHRLEASRNALSKRVGDLSVLQHSALQTLPMIRMMQANNVVLVEKFHTIQRLTIPAWKRTFLMALALNEQRDAVKLAEDIDDATNYFMKRNSEILHENAVATARSSQRQVIDVETLRAVHENVIRTLADVQTAYDEGAQKRTQAMAEIAQMRASMIAGFARDSQRKLTR